MCLLVTDDEVSFFTELCYYSSYIQWPLLLKWINFNPDVNEWFNPSCILGMNKYFHPAFYWADDKLPMLALNLFHVSKTDPS